MARAERGSLHRARAPRAPQVARLVARVSHLLAETDRPAAARDHVARAHVAAVLVAIGKASLFVYVVQYVLVQTLPGLLGWHGELGYAALIVMAVLVVPALGIAALAWNGRRR